MDGKHKKLEFNIFLIQMMKKYNEINQIKS